MVIVVVAALVVVVVSFAFVTARRLFLCISACENERANSSYMVVILDYFTFNSLSLSQHNSRGINCEKCKEFFYRPLGKSQADIDACQGKKKKCYETIENK